MPSDNYSVVDLGTKKGSAIHEFLSGARKYWGKELMESIKHSDCLGLDRDEKYRDAVEGRGYQFKTMTLDAANLDNLPFASFYLAWDFLEHLPSVEFAKKVFEAMVVKSVRGVWLRMPSFETDTISGEGVLRQLGLQFAWSTYHGHTARVLLRDITSSLYSLFDARRFKHSLHVVPMRRITSTSHEEIVPLGAPVDTVLYDRSLGPKPTVNFGSNPLFGQWDLIIKLD
jgi:hypothetical protein